MADGMVWGDTVAAGRPRYYGLLWRWHFFAALLVIPFVLWQSTTGTLYLWSEWWMDQTQPAMRFVEPRGAALPPGAQLAGAIRDAGTDTPVLGMLLPADPARSTTVLLQGGDGLPYPVFVDPYTAHVLGTLTPAQWLPGLTRALHGGWPLGDAGSWLLELADGWAIVMVLTGFYLWWPRGRPFPEVLWPRFRHGARVVVKDLHASVAVLFSLALLFFLISALPWTSFWGGQILSRIQAATGQTSPAGFSNGGASAAEMLAHGQALDEAVAQARARGVKGLLDVRLSPWPGAPLWLTNQHMPGADRTLHADPQSGQIIRDVRPGDLPAIPRFVAFGIHVHQGDFGIANLMLNTGLALSLIWLSVTGFVSWWLRRPEGRIAPPPKTATAWPKGLIASVVTMCAVLPIFGLSVIVLLAGERMAGALRKA
ncbi:MAG: PepSY domain-containing protein [Alphaproteobacteria bacterium]|nr:PepSY domain-containing protein [Alphaproteobacteria bacterium]OJU56717.1 MAG: hypothetical protein BGO00_12370 [Alphaproteobacteria bacterium 62-8]